MFPCGPDALDAVVTDLHRHAPRWLERYHVPGAAIAIMRNHEVAWQGAVGVLDSQANAPLSSDNGVSVACADAPDDARHRSDLQQQGGLQLERLIAEAQTLKPETPRVVRASRARPINTQGASRIYVLPDRAADPQGPAGSQPDASHLLDVTSNRLFAILQLTVELESNRTFSQVCRQRIYEPLTLSPASDPQETERQLACGYSRLGTKSTPLTGQLAGEYVVSLSASDMATMLINLAPAPGARIGRQHAVQETVPVDVHQAVPIEAPHQDAPTTTVPRINSDSMALVRQLAREMGIHDGLEVRLVNTTDGRCLELSGDQNGCGCYARYYCDLGTGAVVLFNSETGQPAAERIVKLAIGGS
jgi:hypothetical protein